MLPLPWYTCPHILFLIESAYSARDTTILTEEHELLFLLYARICESTNTVFRTQLESYYDFDTLSEWSRNPRTIDTINNVFNWIYKAYKKEESSNLDLDQINLKFGNWEHTLFDS